LSAVPTNSDTIAALATPGGVAALAILRVSGGQASRVAREIFGELPLPRVVQHGDYVDRSGTIVDDVLFTVFAAPNSYTGEDALEISCHGNPFIAQRILEDLFGRGCRAAGPGEFTQRAFLNGRMDLSQAEAVMDLIHARSERALAAANRQLRGALGRHLEGIVGPLLGAAARVEAYIDFPEEDLPAEDRDGLRRLLESILLDTGRLLATQRYGDLLRDGIRTVIVGEPNAGKSSILNRLVGSERAIVSSEPGTTRDFIEERVSVGPHWLRLVDTAGLNPSAAGLEKLGVEKTLERASEADLFILVLDAARPTPPLPADLALRLTPRNTVVALNKIDLVDGAPRAQPPAGLAAVAVSALRGSGFEALSEAIARLADGLEPEGGEDAVAINSRHAHALRQATECLAAALAKTGPDAAPELLASDLRGALDAFGEISGRIDHERVLDELFAAFCIGK
jgi:tRNA modification GTPase